MNWKDVMKIIEECRHDIIVTPVTWEKPPPNTYKLNTDGSALTNPGRIGGGGIIRDDFGNLVYAFAVPLGTGTNSLAEIQAAIYGIQWGLQNGFNRLVLEVDSELVTRWINTTNKPPWKMMRASISKNSLGKVNFSRHISTEKNQTY
ncbi:hypothetical protein R3W88_026641 [Solanum pinnatisectum]|uniref:RNase H type-1 domain-containing protein n=1 Tax=Solanum pinnatisectum TaxID=50273 RepID=A0AAV9LDX5_9SOLN|nr:hypothetical protein R3W88_026641 [Solanum pinnatisectum]